MIFELCGIFVLAYLAWFYFENYGNVDKRQPPGPIRIPPFGNLIQIGLTDRVTHMALQKMAKHYGDVMSIKMGLLETVILSSYEAVKQVLSKEEAAGRDCTGFILDRNLHNPKNGLVFSDGLVNDTTRKFCSDTLRMYGYRNRQTVQNMLLDELTDFVHVIEDEAKSNAEHRVHFGSYYFNPAFLNIMSTLVMGKRFKYSDPKFQKLLKHEDEFMSSGLLGSGLITAYPFLRHIFPKLLSYDVQMSGMKGFHEVATEILHEKKKGKYDTNPTCFTDDFLQKMDVASTLKPEAIFTEDQFKVLFCDLIQPGTDTSNNVFNFILLHLTSNQEIQQKVYDEIMNVVGSNRIANLDDKASMPYTTAVTLEGLRWNRVVVLGAPRKVLKDFTYKNFKIKKGTVLLYNMQSVFFDKEFWGDPEVFRPERFLDEDGKLITKKVDCAQLAFGAGKRSCFGETMGRDSLFIFTTYLIQKFKFTLPPGPKPNLQPKVCLNLCPYPYDAIVTPRKPS